MRLFPRALRELTVTYGKADLLAVSLIAAVVSIWAAVAGGAFSIVALLACEAMFFAFYLVGSLFAGWASLAAGVLFDLPLRLLVGYAVVNTALLVLAWLSPLGIVANFGSLLLLAIVAFFSTSARKRVRAEPAGLWLLALCVLATTLWCQDSIRPTSDHGEVVFFGPWIDGFYHSVHIRIFGASHGAASIEDFRLAGVPARPYHYGMYMLPAFVKQAAGIHSYSAFAGILAPVGVLFTGLAAYAFIGSIWGAWPGLAAAAALFLLPDGAQQGLHNTFMSYHWLTQISPSATYGLALLAVAWLFVIQGCAQGSWLKLCTGWAAAAILAVYKLHYVVASALLLLLIPALFFRAQLSARKRALWAAAAGLIYVLFVSYGQKVPGVPVIRFDGSNAREVLQLVLSFAKGSAVGEFVVAHVGARVPFASSLLFGVPYVLFAALGLFLPLLVVLALRLRGRTPGLYVLFPLALIANFLAMFFGLALDFTSSTPDELSHRPIMIVYFFVASWVGGALCLTLLESRRLGAIARNAMLGLGALLLLVPAFFGSGVQLMPAMPLISPVRLPVAYLKVAEYIRTHGGPEDVFQHSHFDRTYVIAALSERRPFVAHTLTLMPYRSEMVQKRTGAIEYFMGIRQAQLVVGTAHAFGFRWFVLERGERVDWPPEIADRPVLEIGPLKLYEF